jgi:hypothetical protein
VPTEGRCGFDRVAEKMGSGLAVGRKPLDHGNAPVDLGHSPD